MATEEAGTARYQIAATTGFADAASGQLPVWTPATTEAFQDPRSRLLGAHTPQVLRCSLMPSSVQDRLFGARSMPRMLGIV